MKISPLFWLGTALGGALWLFTRARATEEEEAEAKPTGTGGVIPKKGRTWDLANWSEVAKGPLVPPPGLPLTARKPGASMSALPAVTAAAAQYGSPGFTSAMEALAINESGARFALPAWTFDSRPKAERPPGKSFISAWGVFQWQNAHAKHNFGVSNAYQMTPEQEIAGTIARYAEILEGIDNDPAGVFLWHISPAAYKYARARIKEGVPTREAIYQGAASRGDHWPKVLDGYLKKWDKRYPAAVA